MLVFGTFSLSAQESAKSDSITYSEAHKAKAIKLLKLLELEATIQKTLDHYLNTLLSQGDEMLAYKDIMLNFLTKHLTWEKLKDGYAKIYLESYTESELSDLVNFYKSKTGQKTIKLQSEIMIKSSTLAQEIVLANISELQTLISIKEQEANSLD